MGGLQGGRSTGLGAIALALLALGCAPAGLDADGVGVSEEALGEPLDGFPTWEERVVHVWANRARAAPADDLAGCTVCAERACYTPQPPLAWTHDLARAARFHSENLQRGGCSLQHDSPCTLVSGIGTSFTPGPCNGAPSCACTGGAASCGSVGTSTWDRLAAFGFAGGARAENIAAGSSDPVSTFYQWLHEADASSACGWRAANGHRFNILSGSYHGIGVGKASAGSVWTQDFTSVGAPTGIVAGVHYPRTGTSIAFRANWYSSAAPTSAQVNVDGTCQSMALERGSATNGTYLATVSLAAGCHRYVFRFGSITYPSTGSYGVGCSTDWDAAAPAACGAGALDGGALDGGPGDGGPGDGGPGDGGAIDAGRDAGPMSIDAGRDAGLMSIDAGRDAGAVSVDAGRDAGPMSSDAGAMSSDAGAMPTDAGATPSDAGAIPSDAGATSSDAGATPTDAGASAGDSGARAGDAGGASSDAAASDDASAGDATVDGSAARDGAAGAEDAGDPGEVLVGDCGCVAVGARGASRSPVALIGLAGVLALAARARRRAR